MQYLDGHNEKTRFSILVGHLRNNKRFQHANLVCGICQKWTRLVNILRHMMWTKRIPQTNACTILMLYIVNCIYNDQTQKWNCLYHLWTWLLIKVWSPTDILQWYFLSYKNMGRKGGDGEMKVIFQFIGLTKTMYTVTDFMKSVWYCTDISV